MPRGKLTPAEARNAIREICEKKNYDPFRELIDLATQKQQVEIDGATVLVHSLDTEQRIAIAKEIAGYMAPKLKNIEVKGEITGDIHITVKSFAAPGQQPILEAKTIKKELVETVTS